MVVTIRRATKDDAAAGVETLRRSITELCVLDHQDDPQQIADWLGNKTVLSWLVWTARTDAEVIVAEQSGRLAGIGMVDRNGAILLNYVHPNFRFCGVSKAMLGAMEREALLHGALTCFVQTTLTARPFYLQQRYCPSEADVLMLSKPL